MSESLVLDIDVKPLKLQLREATADLQKFRQKFGETSTEAVNAAKKVAAIKDALQGANEAAQLFDPGSRFQALTNAASMAAGGISAVQGAMALFGAESENVAKTLQKVQGAMALSQGLSQLKDIGKVGEQLKLTFGGLTAGMSTFKKALISTGIGALVAGLGLLIANFDKVKETINNLFPGLAQFGNYIGNLVQGFTDLLGITDANDRALETFRKNNKLRNEQLERDIALLTAQGGKEAEIAEKRKEIAKNELEELTKSAGEKGKLYGEEAKKYKEAKNQIAIIDAEEAKRRKADNEKRILEQIEFLEALIKKEYEKMIEQYNINKTLRDALRGEEIISQKEILELDLLQKEDDEKKKQDLATRVLQLGLAARGAATASAIQNEIDANAQGKAALLGAEKQFANAKWEIVMQGLNLIQTLAGQGTKVAKAAALAQIVIDTGRGFASGLTIAQEGAKATGPAAPFAFPIFYATQIAAVLGAVGKAKSILSQVPGGGSSGGAISAPTLPSAPSVASVVPTLGNSPVTTIATLSNQNQKPIRAYVVESEVTATQRRVSDIERRAGF
jgi:hypothetical protein